MKLFPCSKLTLTIPAGALLAGFMMNATAAPFLPDFSAASFIPGAAINHPYFSLLTTSTYRYEGNTVDADNDPIVAAFEFHAPAAGPTILGVQTTTRLDRAFAGGLLIEDTYDHYAQDTQGNVWYMGEDVTNYIYDGADNLISTHSASSWRAGVNGAHPGFQMPADTSLGVNYYQEKALSTGARTQPRRPSPSVENGGYSSYPQCAGLRAGLRSHRWPPSQPSHAEPAR